MATAMTVPRGRVIRCSIVLISPLRHLVLLHVAAQKGHVPSQCRHIVPEAAKVAAFPLTALILVALIACQGPAGPAGTAGDKGDAGTPGTPGNPGADAEPALQAMAVDPVIFNPGADDADGNTTWATETTIPMDLSMYLVGGAAGDRSFDIETVRSRFSQLNVDLDEETGMLTVSVDAHSRATNPGDQLGDDAVIDVSATDADGNSTRVSVPVRLNAVPLVTGSGSAAITLTIGTQDAAAPGGDYYTGDNETGDAIVCAMLNACTIKLAATDANNQDMLIWDAYSSDPATLVAMATDDGVMLKAQPDKIGIVTVYVWAIDEGGLPMLDPDATQDENAPGDETMYPAGTDNAGSRRTITVTVDGAPYMGAESMSSIDLTVIGGTPVTVGTVYNPEGVADTDLSLDYTPAVQQSAGRVDVSFADAVPADGTNPAYRPIQIVGRNAGPVTVELTVSEVRAENSNLPV